MMVMISRVLSDEKFQNSWHPFPGSFILRHENLNFSVYVPEFSSSDKLWSTNYGLMNF